MPCDDVTEILHLRLDAEDRLTGYELSKRTCGRAVGEQSLLAGSLAGTPAATLLAIDPEDWVLARGLEDDAEVVLTLKHLFALQGGLRALLGLATAGPADPVRLVRVGADEAGTSAEIEVAVDVITEQIKSCGRCKGCGALARRNAGASAAG